jgi:hypothetical protein
VTDFSYDKAFQIPPYGVFTQIIDSSGDGVGNRLVGPSDIAVDGSANVYVIGTGNDNVFKIEP